MNRPHAGQSGDQLQFLRDLVEEHALIAGDVVRVAEHRWAIHGFIAVDGEVLMAEFDSYEQATRVLGEVARHQVLMRN